MARVLIAGCGDVGTVLGLRLHEDGHEVWGLRREAGRVPAPIRGIAADLAAPSGLDALPGGIELVCYTAAAGGSGDDAYRAAYVDGVRNLLAALRDGGHPVHRFCFVSSTAVYGQDRGEWVDEESPTEPNRFTGRRLLEGEALVRATAVQGVVVRLAGIYGPGRERLIRQVLDGEPCQAEPPSYTNRIHRDDCAGVLRHVLLLDDPAPVYIGVDNAPAPQCEVFSWLAERLGVPPSAHQRAGNDVPARMNKRCRNERLRASGYRFLYPTYREGYAAVIQGMGLGKASG